MKEYICPKCEKSLASSSSLWNHKQRCKNKSEEEVKPIESEIEGLPEAIDAAYTKLVESDGDTSFSESDNSNTKSVGESDDENENVKSDEEIVMSDDESDDKVMSDTQMSDGEDENNESAEPSDNENETVQEMITSTFNYVIAHDKEEMENLLSQLKIYIDAKYLDLLQQLIEMVHLYYESDYIKNDSILPLLEGLVNKLDAVSSMTAKTKLLRVKMIANDIAVNRDRITEIFNSLSNPSDNVQSTLKILWVKNLLSNEQYKLLSKNKFDLNNVKEMLMKTKYGRGESFLPRRSVDILEKLHHLVEGNTSNDKQILAMVNELYERGCFTHEQYKEMTKDE